VTSRLAGLLTPQSIALVGCPGDLDRPGARPLQYLLKHGYRGAIYPVNARRREIGGVQAYPSLGDLPERPDVAWIGVPGSEVEAVLVEAGQLKIPYAVVLTAGFGETDEAGKSRQAALRSVAEAAGIAVLGPNMLGFINCWDRVPLTFSSAGAVDELIPGALGIASQSGALGGIVVNRAFDRRVGVSAMISTGNELGITVSECLEHFAEDPRTRAVAAIVEGVRDGERFKAAAARLLEAGKTLVALKSGRSRAGRRNALTHTGALAGSHAAWQAVARHLGIVEVDTLEDLLDVAGFLSRETRPVGRSVGVLTSSGGASIMSADQLERHGFDLPRLTAPTVAAIGRLLPEYAVTRDNPVDVTAGLGEDLFGRVLSAVVADPRLDAVSAIVTGARGVERAENIVRAATAATKPVVACWLGGSVNEEGIGILDRAGVACFRSVRAMAAALAAGRDAAAARRAWLAGAPARRRAMRPDASLAARAGRVEVPVPYRALADLARQAGVPLAAEVLVASPVEAARAARRLGFPVALKVIAGSVPHKTEAGGVVLGLATAADVAGAAARLLRGRRGPIEGLLVQRMVRGLEVLVGVTRDEAFGLLLVIGAGGVQAELLADTACRPLPVTPADIRAMIAEVRCLRALSGWRGAPPADVAALVRAIAAVAELARAFGPRLVALDVNPVIVGPRGGGAAAVDLLLQLSRSAVPRDGSPLAYTIESGPASRAGKVKSPTQPRHRRSP
jgi:acyl-CoA synthetase (NDP forming)